MHLHRRIPGCRPSDLVGEPSLASTKLALGYGTRVSTFGLVGPQQPVCDEEGRVIAGGWPDFFGQEWPPPGALIHGWRPRRRSRPTAIRSNEFDLGATRVRVALSCTPDALRLPDGQVVAACRVTETISNTGSAPTPMINNWTIFVLEPPPEAIEVWIDLDGAWSRSRRRSTQLDGCYRVLMGSGPPHAAHWAIEPVVLSFAYPCQLATGYKLGIPAGRMFAAIYSDEQRVHLVAGPAPRSPLYPDRGSSATFYAQGGARSYVEAEINGSLTALAEGRQRRLSVRHAELSLHHYQQLKSLIARRGL